MLQLVDSRFKNILTALAYLTFSNSVHAVHFPPFLTHCLKYFRLSSVFPHSLSIRHTALAQQFNHTHLPFRFFHHTDDNLKPTLYGYYGAQFVKDLHCNLALHFQTMALVSGCTKSAMPLHQLQFHGPSENCFSHLAQEQPILKLEILLSY
jgi:hypothetical protein